MTANPTATVSAINDKIKTKVSNLISQISTALNSTKPTLDVLWQNTQLFVVEIIKEIQIQAGNAAGSDKKAAALASATAFFTVVILPHLSIPYLPVFIANFVLKYAEPLFLLLVAGTVDAIVTLLKNNNIAGFKN